MKICDECNSSNIEITLIGYKNPLHSGLLLPERFQESNFCSVKCFLKWTQRMLNEDPRAGEI